MMDFLFWLPLWLLAFVLIIWLAGTALVGLWAVRRWVLPRLKLSHADAPFAAAAAQSGMVLYGLVAALTAVAVWQRYGQVADIVSAEATAITNVWRDVGGYPEPTRTAARDILRDYTEQIINDAWPKQQAGRIPTEGVEWMDKLQAQMFAFEPKTESQKILHAEALRAFNNLVQQRRQRLDCVTAALPVVFWWVLLPGAVGSIVLFLFFHIESARFHAAMLVGVAAFLSMVLFVIIALDRPFCGDMGITADSYQLIYDHHMRK